ncbi:MAG: amino acid ABC transporter substrate-binding protein, partial [Anaerolineae bacterium]
WAKLVNERGGLLGRPVELIVSDNRSDTETAVAQYERLINVDKVDLLFGTFSSKLTFPTTAVSEKAGMVYPVPSGGAIQIWERGFKNLFYFQQVVVQFIGTSPMEALAYYRDQGVIKPEDFPQTAALVYADDFFANAIAAGLLGEKLEEIDLSPGFLADGGIEVVFNEQWPEGFTDWITLANSVKASDADFLIVLMASTDEAIEIVRALQTVDYNPKGVYMSQGTQFEFKEALGDAVNGITIYSSWHPNANFEGLLAGEKFTNQDFIEVFQDEFGREPSEDEAIPFAVAQGMEQAVRATGTTDNAEIRDWLASRTADDPVRTVLGDYYYDERGLPIDRVPLMVQWQEGELVFVYPVGEFPGTKDLLWPKPEW